MNFRERISRAHAETFLESGLDKAYPPIGEYVKKAQQLMQQAQKAGDSETATQMFDVTTKLQYVVALLDDLDARVHAAEKRLAGGKSGVVEDSLAHPGEL